MKFNCGPRALSRDKQLNLLWEWHDHFAWLPVRLSDTDCRWLETVQRQCLQASWVKPRRGGDYISLGVPHYRAIGR